MASIRNIEIEISDNEPFANCKLGREVYAEVLTTIVDSYADGFVLAINNEWGTGKTTFVKMWQTYLKKVGHNTVYFNAWENDFEDNALVALMGELKAVMESSNADFKSALSKAAKLSKHLVPVVTKAILNKYVDGETLKAGLTALTEGVTDVFEHEVNEYASKKASIKDFKNSLVKLIETTQFNGKPLVFIIDELDRCRPNYAVSILEQIKHFFSVPNIVFVLSIDKEQLGHAVRGVYGSDKLNADEYLRRFIDIEYSLPQPDAMKYAQFLYKYYEIEAFFNNEERVRYPELMKDGGLLFRIISMYFSSGKILLRQQEKIFILLRISLKGFKFNEYVLPDILFFLCFVKMFESSFYFSICNGDLTVKELQVKFYEVSNKYLSYQKDYSNELLYLEMNLIHSYNKFNSYERKEDLLKEDSHGNFIFKSKYCKTKDAHKELVEGFNFDRSCDIALDHLFKRINLLDALKN
ncbi:KAP family P-loop NTPase fold protein [Neptunitalea lumnitzerae]|uniref:NTPase n=1 Tax=Neptunitalea lumnitzerae TaxID=2965509 RepID=A0ABQ5MET9_9FLAO|nr:P-loop NTPase fold protein [Neptunitalea sp. Y10]GLB47831.1 NTPase [Neptunitalea sp. Y10]